jgi:predicted nucleotidyltransferase
MVMKSGKYRDELLELLKKLAEKDLDFVICGGVACVLQGVERATYDLDIAIAFENKNIEKLISSAKEHSLKPRIPEPAERLLDENRRKAWVKEKGAIVFTFFSVESPLQLDIFLTEEIPYDELKKSADIFEVEGMKLFVCSKKQLVKLKKLIEPLRDKDMQDIKELEKLINEEGK